MDFQGFSHGFPRLFLTISKALPIHSKAFPMDLKGFSNGFEGFARRFPRLFLWISKVFPVDCQGFPMDFFKALGELLNLWEMAQITVTPAPPSPPRGDPHHPHE